MQYNVYIHSVDICHRYRKNQCGTDDFCITQVQTEQYVTNIQFIDMCKRIPCCNLNIMYIYAAYINIHLFR